MARGQGGVKQRMRKTRRRNESKEPITGKNQKAVYEGYKKHTKKPRHPDGEPVGGKISRPG